MYILWVFGNSNLKNKILKVLFFKKRTNKVIGHIGLQKLSTHIMDSDSKVEKRVFSIQ